MIFDLLHLDGRRVRDLPYVQRRELLEGLGLDGPRWRTPALPRSAAAPTCSRRPAARASRASSPSAHDSPYRPGKRTGEWIKTRVWRRQEFVIGGYIPGEGSRANRVGSLLVGYYDKRRLGAAQGRDADAALRRRRRLGAEGERPRLPHPRAATSASAPTAPSTSAPRGAEGALRGLVRARAGLRGLLDRVDQRGHPAPAGVQGHARRQGPARGRQGVLTATHR